MEPTYKLAIMAVESIMILACHLQVDLEMEMEIILRLETLNF